MYAVSNTTGHANVCEFMGEADCPQFFCFLSLSCLTYGLLPRIFLYSPTFSAITLSVRNSCSKEPRYALSNAGRIFPGRGKAPLSDGPKLARLQSSFLADILAIGRRKQQPPSSLGPSVAFNLPLDLNGDHDLSHRRLPWARPLSSSSR